MAQRTSPLDELRAQDEHNYKEIRKAFENETLIADDVVRAYDLYRKAVEPHLANERMRVASAIVGGICGQHLIRGALSLFRLHSAQMFRETRSAVEAAGIAHAIQHDEKKLQIFLQDEGRPEQRRKARSTFRPRIIFPDDQPLLKILNDHYEVASLRSHTNVLNFVLHLSKSDEPGRLHIHAQDIPRKRLPQDFPLLLFWLCQAHVSILCCVEIIFPGLPSTKQMSDFFHEHRYIFEKVQRFNQNHQSQLAQVAMPPITT
ncbi:MAG: hypothetical protein WAM39_03955 [Bryobacteraceae bacterium]